MSEFRLSLFRYFITLFSMTLGLPLLCGFSVGLCTLCFRRLVGAGSRRVLDVTSPIGTPVHELGHAMMCPLFGHRIESMRLFAVDPRDGLYGYVEHSYNKKNPWAVLGNLFIGIGPIISGMLITVLTLRLCFPLEWASYRTSAEMALGTEQVLKNTLRGLSSLLSALPSAFLQHPARSLLGLLVILPISLHISLSRRDIKGMLKALPLYGLLILAFSAVTLSLGVDAAVIQWLALRNLQLLALFLIVLAASLFWVLLGLLVRLLSALF